MTRLQVLLLLALFFTVGCVGTQVSRFMAKEPGSPKCLAIASADDFYEKLAESPEFARQYKTMCGMPSPPEKPSP